MGHDAGAATMFYLHIHVAEFHSGGHQGSCKTYLEGIWKSGYCFSGFWRLQRACDSKFFIFGINFTDVWEIIMTEFDFSALKCFSAKTIFKHFFIVWLHISVNGFLKRVLIQMIFLLKEPVDFDVFRTEIPAISHTTCCSIADYWTS